MKKFLMIAAMAMFATVACDNGDDPKPVDPTAPDATITAPADVQVGKTGTITATLSAASKGEVTIKIANSDAAVLTVAATEIKIAAGATSGTATITGVKEGSSKVSFTSETAKVKTAELTITVKPAGVEPGAEYEYPTAAWGTYFGMSKVVIGTTTVTASCASDEKGDDKPLIGDDGFMTGGISDDRLSTIVPLTEGIAFTIFADNFTSTNGEYDVFFYIDWNGNGKFEEATELVKVQKAVSGSAQTEITGTIAIPATAVASSRARIIVANEENDIEDGIGSMDSGYMMDFMYSK